MRKQLVLTVFSTMVAALPTLVQANDCGCGSTTQSVQRYSYQPAASSAVVTNSAVQTMAPSDAVATPSVARTQNYRRYSYQPQARSTTSHQPAYLYPKTDPRRYR